MMHSHMMRQPCVSKVCPLGILMSSGGSSEWYMQVQTGGVIGESVDLQPT